MDSELQHIADKVRSGRRIDAAEALALWRGAPLWLLGELADGRWANWPTAASGP